MPPALGVLGRVSKVRVSRAGLGHLALYCPTPHGVYPTLPGGQRCKAKTHVGVPLPGPTSPHSLHYSPPGPLGLRWGKG